MTYQQEYISRSESLTKSFGRILGAHAVDGLVLALQGDLGAGKTHLAQGLAEGLGIGGTIASPTFTLLNEYEGEGHPSFHHFDWYRLEQVEELENVGFYEYGTEGVTLIEWADRFRDEVPLQAIWIHLEKTADDAVRKIIVNVPERRIAWWKGVDADVVSTGYFGADFDGGHHGR